MVFKDSQSFQDFFVVISGVLPCFVLNSTSSKIITEKTGNHRKPLVITETHCELVFLWFSLQFFKCFPIFEDDPKKAAKLISCFVLYLLSYFRVFFSWIAICPLYSHLRAKWKMRIATYYMHLPLCVGSIEFDVDSVIWLSVELLLIKMESSFTCGVVIVFVRFFVWCDADLNVPWARVVFALQISQFFANDSWCCGLLKKKVRLRKTPCNLKKKTLRGKKKWDRRVFRQKLTLYGYCYLDVD